MNTLKSTRLQAVVTQFNRCTVTKQIKVINSLQGFVTKTVRQAYRAWEHRKWLVPEISLQLYLTFNQILPTCNIQNKWQR